MRTQTLGALLVNAAVLSVALACEGRNSPAAPAVSSSSAASKVRGSFPSGISASAEQEAQRGCTNASLEGAYGFVRTGSTSAGPLAAVGLATYDGAGNWVASQTISRHGVFTFDVVSTGAYIVNADCTGKVLSNGEEIGLLDLVDRGNGVFLLSEAAGDAVSEVQEKVGQSGCTNASLEGAYGFVRTGTTSAGPLAALGFGTFDGSGNDVARQTTSRNGVFTSSGTFPGKYEVGADCQGKFLTPSGQEFSRFILVDRGNEIFQISETAGNAVTGVQRRVHRGHEGDVEN